MTTIGHTIPFSVIIDGECDTEKDHNKPKSVTDKDANSRILWKSGENPVDKGFFSLFSVDNPVDNVDFFHRNREKHACERKNSIQSEL